MNGSTLKELVKYLRTGCSTNRADVPDLLIEEGFVECTENVAGECPNRFCDADIARSTRTNGDAGTATVVCNGTDSHRETIPTEELLHCSLNPDSVTTALCEHLDVEQKGELVKELPDYIGISTNNNVDIRLITDPSGEAQTAESIVRDAIEHGRVVVLLSLEGTVEHLIEVIDRYALAVVRPYPLSKLNDPTGLKRLMASAIVAREREREVQELYDLDEDDLMVTLSKNPGMIGEKMAHLYTLRKTGGMSNSDIGDAFEKVCRAAFIMLEGKLTPGEGGGDQKGGNVADTAFELPPSIDGGFPGSGDSGYEEIFAVVDAKSGLEANLDSEKVLDKHERYIDRTRIRSLRHHHTAHVVVGHDLTGAEDIRWYHRLKKGCAGDYSVVILMSGALFQLVTSFGRLLVKNELGRAESEPVEIIRPFFDNRVFERELDPEVKRIIRDNPPQPEHLPDGEDDYREALRGCEDLIVVTEEMVIRHLESKLEGDFVARRLSDYHQQ